jgi:hypothetical protein
MVYLLGQKLSLTAHPLVILRPTPASKGGDIPATSEQAFARGVVTLELPRPRRISELRVTLRGLTTVTSSEAAARLTLYSIDSTRTFSTWFDNQLGRRAYASLPHQHVHFEREVRCHERLGSLKPKRSNVLIVLGSSCSISARANGKHLCYRQALTRESECGRLS